MQQDAAMESEKWQHCRPPCCAQLLSVTAECGRWLTGEEALEDTTREDGDVLLRNKLTKFDLLVKLTEGMYGLMLGITHSEQSDSYTKLQAIPF